MASPDFGADYFVGRGAVSVLGSFPAALAVGLVLGFLAGLGIGGGSLLMLWLTLILGLPQETARSINLLFFIPAAVCSCFFRWKQGSLPLKKLWLPISLGCLSAAAFSYLGTNLDTEVLKKIFGILLLVTGVRELRYKE